jgi:AraC-like DNA-binding protein
MPNDSQDKIGRMYHKSRLVYEREALVIPGIHSLGKHYYTAAAPGLPPHCHPGCVEISLLARGCHAYRIGDKTYHVNGGEQYTSLPGEVHDTGYEPETKGELFWLILDVTHQPDKFLFLLPHFAKGLIADLRELSAKHFVANPKSCETLNKAFAVLARFRSASECTGIFKSRAAQAGPGQEGLERPSSVNAWALQMEFANLIVLYIMQTLQASRRKGREISAPIRKSMEYMAQHDDTWVDLASVAAHVYISESRFKQRFREEVGLPPAEYMLRQKIEVGKVRLSRPAANITDVAYSLGFSSSQYFATVFRRYTNLTPSEYISGCSPGFVRINENMGYKSMYA